MRVSIEQSRCIGSGECVVAQPAVFGQDEEEGFAVLLDERPGPRLAPAVRAAAEGCPVRAIRLEAESNETGSARDGLGPGDHARSHF
ncbi:ferredoxin [Streptomyces sp. NPDC020742]|uniref:ferredoxin n=1 Tax=unclassified Streptomyces TaxID=2593676 RepID=UPI00340A9DC4